MSDVYTGLVATLDNTPALDALRELDAAISAIEAHLKDLAAGFGSVGSPGVGETAEMPGTHGASVTAAGGAGAGFSPHVPGFGGMADLSAPAGLDESYRAAADDVRAMTAAVRELAQAQRELGSMRGPAAGRARGATSASVVPDGTEAGDWAGDAGALATYRAYKRKYPGNSAEADAQIAEQLGLSRADGSGPAAAPAAGAEPTLDLGASLASSAGVTGTAQASPGAAAAAPTSQPTAQTGGTAAGSAAGGQQGAVLPAVGQASSAQAVAVAMASASPGGQMGNMTKRWLAMGAIGASTAAIDSELQYETQRVLHGGTDPEARGQTTGMEVGAGIGLAAAIPLAAVPGIGPFLALGAMAAGPIIGRAIGGYEGATAELRMESALALQGVIGTETMAERGGRSAMDLGLRSSHIARMANLEGRLPHAFDTTEALTANALATTQSAMIAGDIDPNAPYGGGAYMLGPADTTELLHGFHAGAAFPGGPATRAAAGAAATVSQIRAAMAAGHYRTSDIGRLAAAGATGAMAIEEQRKWAATHPGTWGAGTTPDFAREASGAETLSEFVTRRLTEDYGKLAPDMARTIAPIFATGPETGFNLADVVSRYGPETTERYLRATTATGAAPEMDLTGLREASGAIRSAGRAATLGGLLVRGSGAAEEIALRQQMDAISGLPGGGDSVAFGQARQQMIGAELQRFGQEDLGFNRRSVAIAGTESILSSMPYSPGNRFGLAMASIANDRGQLGVLMSREAGLRQRGELSEDTQLQLEQEQWQLRAHMAHEYGIESEGVVDRLPALSVGRPGGFSRFDSIQLAAYNVGRMGVPTRRYGAMGGAQAQMQDAFMLEAAGPGAVPHGRLEGLDSGLAGKQDRTNELLAQLVRIFAGGGGFAKASQRQAMTGRELPTDTMGQPPFN